MTPPGSAVMGLSLLRAFIVISRGHSYVQPFSFAFWKFDSQRKTFRHQSGFTFTSNTIAQYSDVSDVWRLCFERLITFEKNNEPSSENILVNAHERCFKNETGNDSPPVAPTAPSVGEIALAFEVIEDQIAQRHNTHADSGGVTQLIELFSIRIEALKKQVRTCVFMERETKRLTDEMMVKMPSSVCSISMKIMKDPVVAEDGHSYERACIEEWFCTCRTLGRPMTSPLTNNIVGSRLVSNHVMKGLIKELKEFFL